jgi:hypothetical protein
MPVGSVTGLKIELALKTDDGSEIGLKKLVDPLDISEPGAEMAPRKLEEERPSRIELGSPTGGRKLELELNIDVGSDVHGRNELAELMPPTPVSGTCVGPP